MVIYTSIFMALAIVLTMTGVALLEIQRKIKSIIEAKEQAKEEGTPYAPNPKLAKFEGLTPSPRSEKLAYLLGAEGMLLVFISVALLLVNGLAMAVPIYISVAITMGLAVIALFINGYILGNPKYAVEDEQRVEQADSLLDTQATEDAVEANTQSVDDEVAHDTEAPIAANSETTDAN